MTERENFGEDAAQSETQANTPKFAFEGSRKKIILQFPAPMNSAFFNCLMNTYIIFERPLQEDLENYKKYYFPWFTKDSKKIFYQDKFTTLWL